jgi:hypothetical protein
MELTISPSRTYVAIVKPFGRSGYKFRKFSLPECNHSLDQVFQNTSGVASWYYMNELNAIDCIEGCVSFEDYSNFKEI